MNQIIALVLNLIVASMTLIIGVINLNDIHLIWSSSLVLVFIFETIFTECCSFWLGYCEDLEECTVFRVTNVYEFYLWRYYFAHGGIDFGYMPKPPSKQDTQFLVDILGDKENNNVSVPLYVGNLQNTNDSYI